MHSEVYLIHYLRQFCGDVKIAEYAFANVADAEKKQREIIAAYPRDALRFELRGAIAHNFNIRRNAYPVSRAPSGAVSVGGFTVIPTRNAWRVTAPDGAALAVRSTFKRAVLRAWRAAADGPQWRAFL